MYIYFIDDSKVTSVLTKKVRKRCIDVAWRSRYAGVQFSTKLR